MMTLTPAQLRVLFAMLAHYDQHRRWPSIREIQAAVGCKSPNGVHQQLRRLNSKGMVEKFAFGEMVRWRAVYRCEIWV